MQHQLFVGWHRGVITPREPVPLSGMGNRMGRMATYAVLDDLMASITVFADDTGLENAVVFCCMDWLLIQKNVSDALAGCISSATGIPADRIFFCCSHTHCGPDTGSAHRAVGRYLAWLYSTLPGYVQAAVKDLQPAVLTAGTVQTERMNFVRRYILQTPQGIVNVSNVRGDFTQGPILDYETAADHQLQAVRISREQGEDIVLVNFQVHPGFNGSRKLGNVSADVVAGLRNAMESRYPNTVCMFFQGAAGNQTRASKLEEKKPLDREGYGVELTRYAMEALQNGRELHSATPKVVHKVYEPDYKSDFRGNKQNLDLNAISIGQLSFVTAPYEMFSTSGMDIKSRGEELFGMTFVCSCSNGDNKYIPVQRAFDLDPEMKTFEVGMCRFAAGTAEKLVESFKEMLTELK